jgi:tetratricopeptide (TPR) repeat protein
MAQTVQRVQVTPADELRDLLESAEKHAANPRSSGNPAEALLRELDRIDELWPQLEAQGMDLRAEAGRWDTLQATTYRNAGRILAALNPQGGIAALRQQVHPEGTEAPWWHLDEYVKQTRRKRFRRIATIGAIVVVVGLAVYFALRLLFPVDPKVSEAARRTNQGEQLVQQSADWPSALVEFQAATAVNPNDYDAWLRQGAVEEHLGNADAAKQVFDRARNLLPTDLDFYKERASAYLVLGLIDPAEEDIQAALKIKNDDAQAWYQLASVYEARNQIQDAIDALNKTSTYAEETHQDELTAIARYRMGMLMQQLNFSMPPETGTPAP